MINLSIVIPAYNEEKRIGQTLANYLAYFSNKNTDFFVVLNGCIDNTEQVVREYQKKYPSILHTINLKTATGKGLAVHEGFKQAQGEMIGFVDADGATSPQEFEKLVLNINNNDGVIASRWHKESIIENRTLLRKITSKIFIWLVKLIVGLPFSDTQCGAKIFKKAAIKKILPELHVIDLAFDVELLKVAMINNLKIKEVATTWVDQSSSTMFSSPTKLVTDIYKMLKTLLKIRLR